MSKNIVFLIPNFDVIGAQKMCLNVIENLDKKQHRPTLIVQDNIGLLSKDVKNAESCYILKTNSRAGIFSKLQTLYTPFKLAQILNRIKPDIVISIAPGMNIILLISAYFYKFPRPYLIVEEHQHLSTSLKLDKNSHSVFMTIFYKYFVKLYNQADCLKVVSQSSKLDFINNWGIKESKLTVINPPINTKRIIERASKDIPENINSFINKSKFIFSLGRIESQKGFELLIKSFLLSIKADPDLKLIICGDGSLRENFVKYVVENNLEEKILFTGYLDNPYPLFKRASAFCLTSIWEGMPVVLMESMILECPVISVDCPSGPSEMITHYQNGLLVERNENALALAINYVLKNPLQVEIWTKNAVSTAMDWSIENYIIKFKKII
jgi:glycosyltransferase involved in cell wall biosynthesis